MFEVITLGDHKAVVTQAPTNHVYLVDVSGSMFGSLPKMRQHLKNIVSMITKPEDTFSIIYFSGRGQCGVVCEGVPVKDIGSVTAVQNSIDRWLQPIGLTGFHEPMKLSMEVADRLPTQNFNNFVMLTDGYDNQSNRDSVVEDSSKLKNHFNSVSFIEYGWYCDRELLAKMAERSGGIHVFAEGYDDYVEEFQDVIESAVREPRIEVKVNKRAKHAIYILNDNITIIEVEDGEVSVPQSVDKVHSIVPKDVLQKELSEDHLYLIMYYAAKTNNTKLVWRCLEALGDIRLIDSYTNAFTRQEMSEFVEIAGWAALYEEDRFTSGKDLDYLPNESAYTVLDILHILELGEEVSVLVNSPLFEYTRTTRSQKKEEILPRFIPDAGATAYMTGLVYNSTRPNVSIQTLVEGSVEVPENDFGLRFVNSKRYKNYSVIRDGILNIKALPLFVDEKTLYTLTAIAKTLPQSKKPLVEVISEDVEEGNANILLNLSSAPVINRTSAEDVSKEHFVKTIKALNVYQGAVKGLKSHVPNASDDKVKGLAQKHGEDAAKWLSSIGVRDYGFSPKTTSQEPTDAYVATEMEIKVKGLSNLPSVNAVQKKLDADKKLTVSEYLVWKGMEAGNLCKTEEEVKDTLKECQSRVKSLNHELSKMIYTIVIAKKWFTGEEGDKIDFELKFNEGAYKQSGTAELVYNEIKI